uniref:Uncharacterized protein n=1 Tax=Arundo donax TaxID=35708 RepID=A0A0A9E276_ARUDO
MAGSVRWGRSGRVG